ncbi:MAG: tetratricopeptide repeat protein [Candidatus Melainabacteria bacterium]|jgi:tetratricopeptide (TPR) repeat protein|nr:tetratricopeptide repeat protein [Candidatus Melainabacteria bacterium]
MYKKHWVLIGLFLLGIGFIQMPCVEAYTQLNAHYYVSNASVIANQAELALSAGQYEKARVLLTDAIRYCPNQPATATFYSRLARAYFGLGHKELAFASLMQAIRLQPTFAVYYQELVQAWLQTGTIPQAKQDVISYLRMNPEEGHVWFLLGLLYQATSEETAMITAWEQHLRLNPRSPFRTEICQHSSVCVGK